MYRGRFAPSPTGPLHFGSLVAAVASYLEARQRGGEWLLRIEDVDGPRSREGAVEAILGALAGMGFVWDGEVVYQSARGDLYQREMERLGGLVFDCGCSRKEIGEGRYPGTCRAGMAEGKVLRARRLRVTDEEIWFEDGLQGRFGSRLERDLGDFVLWRADGGIWSYQLAVVVDDEVQGVTDVVRGADLMDSTPRQIYLQRLLGYRELRYLHVPLVLGEDGEKLSKQNLAPGIEVGEAADLLARALRFLGQEPPEGLGLVRLWEWGVGNWDVRRVGREKFSTGHI